MTGKHMTGKGMTGPSAPARPKPPYADEHPSTSREAGDPR